MNMVLKKPIISEKSTKLAEGNLYTFLVDKTARKPEIKKAVEDQFGVKVVAVKTANMSGKTKIQRGRRAFYETGDTKKAYVLLKKGQKIGLFEVEAKAEVTTAEDEVKQVKEKKSLLKGTKVKIERGEK